MTVRGSLIAGDRINVVEIFPTILAKQSKSYQSFQASGGMVASLDAPGTDSGWSMGASLTQSGVWEQVRVVKEVSTLVMVATVCSSPIAADPQVRLQGHTAGTRLWGPTVGTNATWPGA